MKIAFILPMPTLKIVGGYKVVYEYANFLVSHGHTVTIFFNSYKGENNKHLPRSLVFLLRSLICRREPKWFQLSQNVKKRNLYSLNKKNKKLFSNFDIVVATAAETAKFVHSLNVRRKVYLIQDLEINWSLSYEQLIDTYNYNDMDLIVVSNWLKDKISKLTLKKVNYIPNGIDSTIFKEFNLCHNNHSICLLYHLDKRKNFKLGYRIIQRLKKHYPDLSVNIFGSLKRPNYWPDWIQYIQNATPQQVSRAMNLSTVFLCTSNKEGFGLTGLESLFCGCTLVTTDCGGIREYATSKNALISPVGDEDSLFKNICMAFDSEKLRRKMKINNNKIKGKFSLRASQLSFEKLIMK